MYTKGGWIVGEPFSNEQAYPVYSQNGYELARVFIHNGEQEANAHLIAKSPRMYELLEEITTTELNAETLYVLQPWLNKVLAILEDWR